MALIGRFLIIHCRFHYFQKSYYFPLALFKTPFLCYNNYINAKGVRKFEKNVSSEAVCGQYPAGNS